MSDVGTALDEIRAELALAAPDFMPDVLTIYAPGAAASNPYGRGAATQASVATNMPCAYRALNAYEKIKGGAVTATATHELKMPMTAITGVIGASYRLMVAARGVTPQLTFEVTGRLDASDSLFLLVAAVLRS